MKRTNSRLKASRRARTQAREKQRLARREHGRDASEREREILALEHDGKIKFLRPSPGVWACVSDAGNAATGRSRHMAFVALQKRGE